MHISHKHPGPQRGVGLLYDEEYEEYECQVYLDEDELARFLTSDYKCCPYYQGGDEYKIVRKQM